MDYVDVPFVPSKKIEGDWQETIQLLDHNLFLGDFSKSQQHLANISQAVFGISLHWLYRKKWNSKHKVPGPRKLVQAVEPFSEVLRALLELTIQTHAISSPITRNYANACDWFRLAAPELRYACFTNPSKAQLVKDLRGILRALNDYKNPFDREVTPNLWSLVEAARKQARESDRFYAEYFRGLKNLKPSDGRSRGFINSLSTWATELDRNSVWSVARVADDEKVLAQAGRGKGMISLPL